MKVELNLTTEQLEGLDNSLSNVLLNLTDEQYTQILKEYINTQFDGMYREYKTAYGETRKEVSDFGKALIGGLQDNIKNAVCAEILAKAPIQSELEKIEKWIMEHFREIVEKAIIKAVTENIFMNKDMVERMMWYQVDEHRRTDHYGR